MTENQTVETDASVDRFLEGVENAQRRQDGFALLAIMRRATGVEARMWGPAIIGFGKYHYRYDSGREGDMLRVGFSPRKANLALYLTSKDATVESLLARLGRHKRGGSCIYLNKLADVDARVLEEMISHSWMLSHEKHRNPVPG